MQFWRLTVHVFKFFSCCGILVKMGLKSSSEFTKDNGSQLSSLCNSLTGQKLKLYMLHKI